VHRNRLRFAPRRSDCGNRSGRGVCHQKAEGRRPVAPGRARVSCRNSPTFSQESGLSAVSGMLAKEYTRINADDGKPQLLQASVIAILLETNPLRPRGQREICRKQQSCPLHPQRRSKSPLVTLPNRHSKSWSPTSRLFLNESIVQDLPPQKWCARLGA